jgi:hypothetical protein
MKDKNVNEIAVSIAWLGIISIVIYLILIQ